MWQLIELSFPFLLKLIGLAIVLLIGVVAKPQSTTSGDTRPGWGLSISPLNIATIDTSIVMSVNRASDSITSLKASVATKLATSAFTAAAMISLFGFTPYSNTNPNSYISSVPAQTFASLTSKPTTLSGYSITDAYPLSGNPSSFLTSLSGAVLTSRTISTTSPLTGGGDLSANRTFAINNAAADNSTKGAATFDSSYFDATSGLINFAVNYGTGSISANAVTINQPRGKITYTSPSISAGTATSVTFTNSYINSTSTIGVWLNGNGSNLVAVNAYVKSQTAGSCVINISNLSLLNLFNTGFIIDFFIVN